MEGITNKERMQDGGVGKEDGEKAGQWKSGRRLRMKRSFISICDGDDEDDVDDNNNGDDGEIIERTVDSEYKNRRTLLSHKRIKMLNQRSRNCHNGSGAECISNNSCSSSSISGSIGGDSQSSQTMQVVFNNNDDDVEDISDDDGESDNGTVFIADTNTDGRNLGQPMEESYNRQKISDKPFNIEMVNDLEKSENKDFGKVNGSTNGNARGMARHFDFSEFDSLESVDDRLEVEGFHNYIEDNHKGDNDNDGVCDGDGVKVKSEFTSVSEDFISSYSGSVLAEGDDDSALTSKHDGNEDVDITYFINNNFSSTSEEAPSAFSESSNSGPSMSSVLGHSTMPTMTSFVNATRPVTLSSSVVMSAEERLYNKTMELFPHLQAIMDGFQTGALTNEEDGSNRGDDSASSPGGTWTQKMSPIFPDLMTLMRKQESDTTNGNIGSPNSVTSSSNHLGSTNVVSSPTTAEPLTSTLKTSTPEMDKEHEDFIKRLTSSDPSTAEVTTAPPKIVDIFKPEKVKRHKCEICGKAFGRSSDLRRHIRIHTGEKNHVCPVCTKAFNQSGDLQRHIKTHSGEKPHACAVCGKGFTQKGDVRIHMRIHTGERPHMCVICNKSFNQSSYLTTHMKSHTGERNHICGVCDKAFVESSDLKKHMRTHTGEKPHQCTICHKAFNRNNNLVRHVVNIHGRPRSSV